MTVTVIISTLRDLRETYPHLNLGAPWEGEPAHPPCDDRDYWILTMHPYGAPIHFSLRRLQP